MGAREMKNVLASLLFVLAMSGVASAEQFMDINFDGDAIGSAPGTGATGSPVTMIGALGGYTATDYNSPPTADNGTIIVDNVAGMSKAAVMATATSNGEVGALFMDTGLSLDARKFDMSFDISILASPATLTGQSGYHLDGGVDTLGLLFGARAYESTVGSWAFSFAVAPTSETGGVFALRDATNTQLTSFGTYVEGQKYNIALSTDYDTGTINAYVDGVLCYSGFPSRTGVIPSSNTPNTSELFFYLNGESGYSNQVAIDNIQGNTVPEPSSIVLLITAGLGMLAVAWRRR
jgi:hypothetical protein